jgi:hypothetical protein
LAHFWHTRFRFRSRDEAAAGKPHRPAKPDAIMHLVLAGIASKIRNLARNCLWATSSSSSDHSCTPPSN